MAREDKAATVAELAEEFRTSSAAVLTEYRGLTVSTTMGPGIPVDPQATSRAAGEATE